MSRDYKRSEHSAPKKGGNPMVAGIFIGVLVGLAMAIGVAVYISQKTPQVLVARPQAAQTGGAGEGATAPRADNTQPAPGGKEAAAAEKPRFDFYTILPGSEEPAAEKAAPQPAERKESYFLQVGAFQSGADADNLKAKLALLGVEATIQTAELPGKGVWHRVRVGPFSGLEELNHTRALLAQNKISSSLVKGQESTTTP